MFGGLGGEWKVQLGLRRVMQFGWNGSNFEHHCFMSGHNARRWIVPLDDAGLSSVNPTTNHLFPQQNPQPRALSA